MPRRVLEPKSCSYCNCGILPRTKWLNVEQLQCLTNIINCYPPFKSAKHAFKGCKGFINLDWL